MTYETVITALADPTRRRIFEDLRAAPMPVAALAKGRPVSRPAVSQHLKTLEQAGLVAAERRGTARIYSVRPQGLAPLRRYIEEFWDDALAAFSQEAERQQEEINRENNDGETRRKGD